MSKKTDAKISDVARPAAGTMEIPLGRIIVDAEFNARKQGMDEESLKSFSRSLNEEGLLQPVVVEPLSNGDYYLTAGFRRVAAAKLLGWPSITATVKIDESKDKKEHEINRYFTNIAENVARQSITPYDLAMRCKLLKAKYEISGSDIARRVGKNVGYINNLLNVVGEGEKGEGVIAPVLSRWETECSWPDDDRRTKVCTTDWLNRCRKMDKQGQTDFLDRAIFISEGGDPEKYDAGKRGDKSTTSTDPDHNTLVRPSAGHLSKALEAAQAAIKSENVAKEEKTRLNGVVEGLKFALGVKSGLTNRIKGVVAFKDGKVVEGANAPS